VVNSNLYKIEAMISTIFKISGIIFGHGESWKEIRRFTLRSLHDCGFVNPETLENSVAEELQDFLSHFDAFVAESKGDVSLHHAFNLPALNLVWRIMAGTRLSIRNPEMQKFVSIAAALTSLPSIGTQPLYAFPFLQYIPGATNYGSILKEFRKMQQVFRVRFNIIFRPKLIYNLNFIIFRPKLIYNLNFRIF